MFKGEAKSRVSKAVVIDALQEYFDKRIQASAPRVVIADVAGVYNDSDVFDVETRAAEASS